MNPLPLLCKKERAEKSNGYIRSLQMTLRRQLGEIEGLMESKIGDGIAIQPVIEG